MISNCGHDENNRYSGGKAGDQTGGEWNIINWYNRPWNVVLRHPNAAVREELALLAERAARNNLIGYDQNQRHTFWQHLKASNYDPAQITIACEADCSSGVLAITKAVGYRLDIMSLKNINQDGYTGNERAILKAAGFIVLTDSKYLTSDAYLLRGDILLYEGHHTATNLTNGSKSNVSAPDPSPDVSINANVGNVAKGQAWLNANYGGLLKANCGDLLIVDNEYGSKSRAAALCVWKDVVNRKYGFQLTPSNSNFLSSSNLAAVKALTKRGDSGTLAFLVQFILSGHKYYFGGMDANFGAETENSVKSFQRAYRLEVDGQVGQHTWNALFNA